MTRKSDKLDALVFIDTNIFLDFYRIRTGGVGLELLKLIEKHKSILVTSSQVEMEYKKNRQAVVLESLKSLKLPDWNGLSSPAFLIKAKPAEMIERHKRSIKEQHKKLKERVASILENQT
jgi:hypothetical protein